MQPAPLEVDAVEATPRLETLACSAVDALGAALAVLDATGAIVLTNKAWTDIGAGTALFGSAFPAGTNYLEALRTLSTDLSDSGGELAKHIEDVAAGRKTDVVAEYEVGALPDQRSYQARITSFEANGDRQVLIVHEELTHLKLAERVLEHRALHDALTDLPNRILFHDRLNTAVHSARRESKLVAVMAIDLDRFKEVNDTFGHHAGDLLLQAVGQRVSAVLRESDTLARMGGDEFGIVLTGLTQPGQASLVASKIIACFEQPFIVEDHPLDVGASIGIAVFPEHGDDPETILRRADSAMYKAKRDGGGFQLYTVAGQDEHALNRLTLMTGLRQAMEHDELLLVYQPKADIATGLQAGVEALVRWQHPDHGVLSPDSFIPLAERTGLIKPLSHWVLNAAMRQCRTWRQAGLDQRIAVNVSIRNLQDQQFPQTVARLLRTYALPPSSLDIEIDESALTADNVIEVVTRLSDLGVGLCIDDFGSGYASLAHLKRLPVRSIKISRSLVSNIISQDQTALIVRSTIELAHQLGLGVIAHGVETAEIYDKLRELGCNTAQGYFISDPLGAAQFEEYCRGTRVAHQDVASIGTALGRLPEALQETVPPVVGTRLSNLLSRIGLFTLLEQTDLEELASVVRRHSHEPGDVIFRKEDSGYTLYLIAAGAVKIAVNPPDGSEVILAILRSGQFFGELSLFDDQPRSADAVAVEQTELLALSREDLLRVLERRPGVAAHLLKVLSQRLRTTNETLHDARSLSLPARVAKRLLDLADLHGERRAGGIHIPLPLGARELANMIGAPAGEVDRVLAMLVSEGTLASTEGMFLIKQEHQLQAISLG